MKIIGTSAFEVWLQRTQPWEEQIFAKTSLHFITLTFPPARFSFIFKVSLSLAVFSSDRSSLRYVAPISISTQTTFLLFTHPNATVSQSPRISSTVSLKHKATLHKSCNSTQLQQLNTTCGIAPTSQMSLSSCMAPRLTDSFVLIIQIN